MFFAPQKPESTVFTMFLPLVAKSRYLHFCVPVPSKNTGIDAVFTILQDAVSICEKDKNTIFYDVFASLAQQKIDKQIAQNGPKPTSKSI